MNPWILRGFKTRFRSHLALAATLTAAALLLSVLASGEAVAGTPINLHTSFAGNINYVTTGNTMRAQPNSTYGGDPCALVSGNTGTSVDAGTSSSMLSGIPAGSTIVSAYLYYDGSGTVPWSNITFNGNALTADVTWTDTSNPIGYEYFGGFKDVTPYVTGNGVYSVGGISVDNTDNINFYCSTSTVMAGWALVVVYSNPSEANRVINIFDGFEPFQGSSITLTPNNFKVPTSPINGKFTDITWEGDPDINSTNGVNTLTETLEFNGNVLSDACNPTADFSLPNGSNGGAFVAGNPNQYNSTINTLSCTGNLTPTGDEQYFGVDVDTFDISGSLSAGETSATTFYSSGQDMVFLTAQVVSVTNTPVTDLAMTKTHSGNIDYGANAVWTLAVKNNGPATTSGTVTVTDSLAAGLSFVSGTGTGWTCGAAGQNVTCTSSTAVASGASFPNITLTAFVGSSTSTSLSNTATVTASSSQFDNVSSNNSSTDSVTLTKPDLSTSTKSVVNTSGGDAIVGSTLQYTVTLTESAGAPAYGASVTDDVPANLTNFTVVSYPSGATNSSTGAGTGANGDGYLNITGITVPANGSVTVVFTAQVASGTANCTNIDNTAAVINPYGNGASPAAPTVEVAQSQCAASGNKILYLYNTHALDRTPQPTSAASVAIAKGSSADWTLTPVLAKNLTIGAGTVTAVLTVQRTGTNSNRTVDVELRTGSGTSIGTSNVQTFNNGGTRISRTFTFTLGAPVTVLAGDTLVVRIHNTTGGGGTKGVNIYQNYAGVGASTETFSATTVINVDSVTAYNAAYPATSTQPVFLPGQTVYLCAVISDPFGSYDIDPATGGTAPQITITDPNGTVQVSAAAMTKEGATDCSGAANSADETFEYAYTTTTGSKTGFWTAAVTGVEGTEGTVTQTSNGSFDLDVPSLLVMKTVLINSDPVEGTTRPKSIPGATVQYTILVQNNGRGPVDSGSLVITDPVPANTGFDLTGATPFTFADGTPSSGLSSPTMSFSNNGGSTYTYSPTCTRPCTDTAITNFKITFTGSMNGDTGGSAPSFTITYDVVIQ